MFVWLKVNKNDKKLTILIFLSKFTFIYHNINPHFPAYDNF